MAINSKDLTPVEDLSGIRVKGKLTLLDRFTDFLGGKRGW